jgi:hypothetical protein
MSISLLLLALAAPLLHAQVPAAPGENLISNAKPSIPPNWGIWTEGRALDAKSPAAAGANATFEWLKLDGSLAIRFVSRSADATASVGAHANASLPKLKPGTLLRASALAKGKLEQPAGKKGFPLSLTIRTNMGKGGDTATTPALGPDGKPRAILGEFDWTPVEAVFALPENTTDLALLVNFANATGEVTFKGIRIEVAPSGATPTPGLKLQARYASPEEQAATDLEKYKANFAKWTATLGIPAPDAIYQPKPALSGPHPRYLFPGTPLAEVKARFKRPEMAPWRDDLFKKAREFASAPPPKPPSMDNEDPLRGYADRLAWMALASVLSEDPAEKKAFLDGAVAYIHEVSTWGMAPRDLPLSQFMFGFAAAYDWLHDTLPADAKAKARKHLIEMARWMRSPLNKSAWQWRSGENWLANHKWFNYSALALAGAVLWGETEAPLDPAEPKLWMDEAMQVFWVVRKTFGPDGAPVEGYSYQSYGNRPLFDFFCVADQLAACSVSFVDVPGIRNMGVSRLHSLLPNGAGFFTYADSVPRTWDGAEHFRYLASRFRDGQSQLLAETMESAEGRIPDLSENYDESLAPYTAPSAPPAKGDPILLEMKDFTRSANVPAPKERFGSKGPVTVGWNEPNSFMEKTFAIPADGAYVLLAKYACAGPGSRSLLLDGQVPFREAGFIPFASTGGWSSDKNQFRFVFLGEEVPGAGKPWFFFLKAGEHKLTLRADLGGPISFDWLALVPPGMPKDAAIAKLGDTDAKVEAPKKEVVRHWKGLFWVDPSLPAAKPAELPLFRDNDDLGLFTARSSWTDPRATWFGFKCGPSAGREFLDTWGPFLTSGHCQPDQGSFLFYTGSRAVVPGSNYEHLKETSSHPVLLVEGKGKKMAGQLIGQLGEGGQWFGGAQKYARSHPTVLFKDHQPGHHTFLAELGGIYGNTEDRDLVLNSYRRSVTYFPSGVVVVADKVESANPRVFHSRIVTAARDMKNAGREFTFHIGKATGRLTDCSPQDWERKVTAEKLTSFPNPEADPPTRNVAAVRSPEVAKAIFAYVLGMNDADKGIKVQADEQKVVITGAPGGTLSLDWKPDLKPVPADPRPQPPAQK